MCLPPGVLAHSLSLSVYMLRGFHGGGGGGGGGGVNSIAIYKPRTAIIYVARGGRTAALGICTAIINVISYNLTFSLMFH